MSKEYVCPWQMGNLLSLSARKLVHNPRRILSPYLSEGMTAMDVGCGMGYFTLPMARLTGEGGRVIAADLQREMLDGMLKKAEKAGVRDRIEPHLCEKTSLRVEALSGTVHFALLFMMLHEVPDPERLVREVCDTLAPGGKLLFAEPVVHVGRRAYEKSLQILRDAGLTVIGRPHVALCRAVLLEKPVTL